MRRPYVRYRCLYCNHAQPRVLNRGPQRQLWCAVCACIRPFMRVKQRFTATTWPPPVREDTPRALCGLGGGEHDQEGY